VLLSSSNELITGKYLSGGPAASKTLSNRAELLPFRDLFRVHKHFVYVGMFLLFSGGRLCAADWHAIGPVTASRAIGNGIEVKAGPAKLTIVGLNPAVVRVRYAKDGQFSAKASLGIEAVPRGRQSVLIFRHHCQAFGCWTSSSADSFSRFRQLPVVVAARETSDRLPRRVESPPHFWSRSRIKTDPVI
jgi:hypothetical protein